MENKIEYISSKILQAQNAYYNGSAIINDDEYDALIYELQCIDPNNKILSAVGADPTLEWEKEKHLYPLGSLNKVNTPDEMSEWISNKLKNSSVLVSEKLDGLSIGLQYQNGKLIKAILRGNGYEGENIFNNVLKMKGVQPKIDPLFNGVIRGEIILFKNDHKTYFPTYSNPRNSASGISRNLDGAGCEHLTVICYDVMSSVPFKTEEEKFDFIIKNKINTPNYKLCLSVKEVTELWKDYQSKIRDALPYEIDGLVVSANDVKLHQNLGEHNLRSKAKMAFKFANQFIKTKVNAIEWVVGNSGRITPLCHFETVNLLGSNISKASIYNQSYINNLCLDVGADILVCKANEIIPRVERVINATGTIAKSPSICPSCNSATIMDGEYLLCPNVNACPAQVVGRVKNWVAELNLLEWGDTLLDRLVESGKVKTIVDLYTLSVDDLASIDRMGKKSAKKCYDILHSNKELPLETFIGALSIPMIGASTIKLIMGHGWSDLQTLFTKNAADFEQVAGVGPIKAASLRVGLQDNKELISELLKVGITIKKKVEGKLSNKSICFTGAMANKRPVLEKMAADAGADVKNSVSKGLSILVIADPNSTSSKAVAARKIGTQLISEEDFIKIVQQ